MSLIHQTYNRIGIFEVGDGCEYGIQFWGNNEKQYYLEENAYVEDTVLIIKGLKNRLSIY